MEPEFDPKEALAMAARARAGLAARAGTPWWYAPGYGLGCGATVASLALPGWWAIPGVLAAMLWVLGLYTVWKRQSGLSVSGYRSGSTRKITAALALGYGVAFGVASGFRSGGAPVWGPIVCGIVLGVFAAWASAAWDRAWRRDILADL